MTFSKNSGNIVDMVGHGNNLCGRFRVIKGAGAAFIGRGISQVLVGWVPGSGNAINTATAAGLTEDIKDIQIRARGLFINVQMRKG